MPCPSAISATILAAVTAPCPPRACHRISHNPSNWLACFCMMYGFTIFLPLLSNTMCVAGDGLDPPHDRRQLYAKSQRCPRYAGVFSLNTYRAEHSDIPAVSRPMHPAIRIRNRRIRVQPSFGKSHIRSHQKQLPVHRYRTRGVVKSTLWIGRPRSSGGRISSPTDCLQSRRGTSRRASLANPKPAPVVRRRSAESLAPP